MHSRKNRTGRLPTDIWPRELLLNAGIFVWNVRTITSVMRVYAPAHANLRSYFPDFYTEKENETIKKLFPYLRSYFHRLLNEKSTGNLCTSGFFRLVGLGDVGALRGLLPQDKSGNATVGADVRLCRKQELHRTYQ